MWLVELGVLASFSAHRRRDGSLFAVLITVLVLELRPPNDVAISALHRLDGGERTRAAAGRLLQRRLLPDEHNLHPLIWELIERTQRGTVPPHWKGGQNRKLGSGPALSRCETDYVVDCSTVATTMQSSISSGGLSIPNSHLSRRRLPTILQLIQ